MPAESGILQSGDGDRRASSLWKRDSKPAAGAICRFQCQLAAVHLDRPFGDGQSQTGAAVFTRARSIDAIETIENSRLQLLGDSRTGVADIDRRPAVCMCDSDFDRSGGGSVFDRVIDEVQERLTKNHTISDPMWNGVEMHLDGLAFLFGKHSKLFGNFFGKRTDIDNIH